MCTKCIECRRHDEGDEIKQDAQHTSVEIWGGMECTINRVHEEYFDQYAWSGHRTRLSEDVASIASLGIKTLRTALHWEYFEATQDWTFFDQTVSATVRTSPFTPVAQSVASRLLISNRPPVGMASIALPIRLLRTWRISPPKH